MSYQQWGKDDEDQLGTSEATKCRAVIKAVAEECRVAKRAEKGGEIGCGRGRVEVKPSTAKNGKRCSHLMMAPNDAIPGTATTAIANQCRHMTALNGIWQ